MKKVLAFTALLLTAALPSAFAQGSSLVGTWKFDAAQSEMGPRPKPKSMMLVIIKDTPQMLAWHLREVDPDGKVVHESWSGPEDGSMHVLKNTEGNGQASFKTENGQIMTHQKLPNGISFQSIITVSDGGNTMTEHSTGTANGQPISDTVVWRRVAHRRANPTHKSM